LDLAQRWQDKADVTGDSLYEAVIGGSEDMSESAFFFFTADPIDPRSFAWNTVISAMGYISWHAYGRRGRLPEPIADVEEEDIDHTVMLIPTKSITYSDLKSNTIPRSNRTPIPRSNRSPITSLKSPIW